MNLSIRTVGGVGVITAHATRIDAAVAIQFKDRFLEITTPLREGSPGASDAPQGDTVLLDLTEVEFLDSSGLGALVSARKLLGKSQRLALAGLQPAVDKVMRLTHMDSVFPIFADADAFFANGQAGEKA